MSRLQGNLQTLVVCAGNTLFLKSCVGTSLSLLLMFKGAVLLCRLMNEGVESS